MTFFKRLIVLTMLFSLLISSGIYAEDADDVFARLSSLGIMTVDENGSFRAEDNLTRAEFAIIVARLMRIPDIKQEAVFSDVSSEHWANGYISQLYKIGVVNGTGEGRFSPELAVTYNEAVKMMVGVLGYGNEAEQKGGYPLGYTAMASSLKLNRNLNLKNDILTRGDIAQIVYNTLDAHSLTSYGTPDYFVEDMTLGEILDKFHDVICIAGIITETNKTSLEVSVPSLGEGEAYIDGTYITTDVDLKPGYYAEVYAREEGNKYHVVNVRYPDTHNTIITADADEANLSNGIFSYIDSEQKDRTFKVESDAVYIYNGRKTSGFVNISSGHYTLIDNNDNRSADVIYIDEPESFLVNRVNESNSMVYFDRGMGFRGRNGVKLDFDDEEKIITLTDTGGNAILVSDIEAGNVITLKASEDMTYIEAVISKDTVEGSIEEKSDENVVIAGNVYEGAYANGTTYLSQLDLSDSGVFSLDCFGKLVGVYGGVQSSGYLYAYCMDAAYGDGLEGGIKLQLISGAPPVKEVNIQDDDEIISYNFQNNDPEVYTLASKLKLNGLSCDVSDIDISVFADSLMAYKLNSEGEIREIYYENVSGRGRINYTFNADIMTFGGESVTRGFVTDKNTSFVLVPQIVHSSEDYMVGVTLTDEQATCKVYGVVFFEDSSYESTLVQPVNIMMIKGTMDSSTAPVPSPSDDVCIVGDVRASSGTIRDDAGSIVYKLTLLNGTTLTEEVTRSTGDAFEVAKTLHKGDLVRYNKDGFGRINGLTKICSVQGLKDDYSDMIYLTSGAETAMYGLIYNMVSDSFDYYSNSFVDKLSLSFMPDGSDGYISSDLKVSKNGETPVYHYNRATGWIEPGELEDTVSSVYAGSDASKAYVLMMSNDVKAVVIISD